MKILKYIIKFLFLPFWYFELCIPREKKLWVFGAWFGQKYSDNSRALYEYMLEYQHEYKIVWITRNKKVYIKLINERKPVLLANSIKGMIICLRASIGIMGSNVNDLNPYFINGIKQVFVFHGMPLKKIGYDDNICIKKVSFLNKYIYKLLMPYYNFSIDMTITSSDFFIPFLKTAFNLQINNILKTGLPRCDTFFLKKSELIIDKIRKKFPECKIIFYMPTFRTGTIDGTVFNPFNFDENIFFKKLEEGNFIFIYKAHYIDESIKINFNNDRFIHITDNDFDVLYLLLKDIDILMTDYSSVYFDFLVTKKPVILAPFDYEEYLKTSREHYFDYFSNIQGNIIKTWEDFYHLLEENNFINISRELIDKYCQYNDGNSCKKLFEQLINYK